MDQAIAVSLLTIGCTGFGTATIVALSARRVHRSALARLVAVFCFIAGSTASALVVVKSGLRFNATASMPMGLYRITKSDPQAVSRGSVVAVCPPAAAAEVGRRRGYLSAGPCRSQSELLLKRVVAIAGDDVTLTSSALFVNGCRLPNSRPLAVDRSGRPVEHWAFGRSRVPRSKVWIYADHERSWDSRYWGPVPVHNVVATAVPLLIVGPIGRFACDAKSGTSLFHDRSEH
jgi:conjugative transfer signal peptidase TraF